jgi:hypothetical protein
MPARSFFSPLGSVLASLAHRYGLAPRLLEHKLRQQWDDIAGAAIGAHTRPDAIRFKRLYLLVRDSVWLQQLTFLKPNLIERVNAAAGQTLITDIVLRVGEVEEKARRKAEGGKEEPATPEAPPEGAVAQAGAYAEAVSDPALRTRLAAVIAQALSPPRRPPVP